METALGERILVGVMRFRDVWVNLNCNLVLNKLHTHFFFNRIHILCTIEPFPVLNPSYRVPMVVHPFVLARHKLYLDSVTRDEDGQ